ncbi:hypothetical protein ACQP3C_27690, partial [Escherichia coli]
NGTAALRVASVSLSFALLPFPYSFRDSVHCHHGGEHGNMQADVELATFWLVGNRKLTQICLIL